MIKLHYEHIVPNANALEDRWDDIKNVGGAIFCAWRGKETLSDELDLKNVDHDFTIHGYGRKDTILKSAYGKSIFSSGSKANWSTKPTLDLARIDFEGNVSPVTLNAKFYNVLWDNIKITGTVKPNNKMFIVGGSGAPTAPSAMRQVHIEHEGGVGNNYIGRMWLENIVNTGMDFILKSGDIAGCLELFGTKSTHIAPVVHHWGGRDILRSVFYINGDDHKCTILDYYAAQSNEANAPIKCKSVVGIKNASTRSKFALLGNYRPVHIEEAIYYDDFTYQRCKPNQWGDTPMPPDPPEPTPKSKIIIDVDGTYTITEE